LAVIANVARLVLVRCNFCSREKPSFQVTRLTTGQAICEYCLDWHFKAIDFLDGGAPAGCQICGRSWAQVRAETPYVEIGTRMYVVLKDGIYQLLCAGCKDRYTPKRLDLYQGTAYGAELQHR
jgi:hypothetical protein